MSLFGGSASQSPNESDNSQSSIAGSSPSIAVPASPQSAQPTQKVNQPIHSDADDDLYTDSEIEDDNSDENEPTRPNSFDGQPQTWKRYTAADRQIAASLDQIRDSDLAAHLYNAHALKRRVRRPAEDRARLKDWQSRDNWLKSGKELQYIDASGLAQTELVPSKDWTAWPLPPARLPDIDSQSVRRFAKSKPGQWMIGGTSTHDAGEELRDELLAVFLRLTKERWNSRDAEDETHCGRDRTTVSRSRSQSKGFVPGKSRRSASRPDTGRKDNDGRELGNKGLDKDGEIYGHTAGRTRGRKAQADTFTKPTFLADDARAQRLLQPTMHSMLSKLDDLALAVRRTRLNHFGRGESSDGSSYSGFTSGIESGGSNSRSSSKAGSKSASRNPSTRPTSRVNISRTASRPKKVSKDRRELSESDSGSSTVSDSDVSSCKPHKRKRQRSASVKSKNSASTPRDESWRAGLMDWSEVLGLAAIKGWNEQAIVRTAQRCASLFGESMTFIPLNENLGAKFVAEPVHYTPSIVPNPGASLITGPLASKRPLFQTGTLRCPHTDCYGHEKDFALAYRVVEHCMRVHGYDPRTNDSDNEERTVGGVHADGFLQPVTLKPGWLGHGRSKAGKASKKRKARKKESADASDADETIAS